LQYHTAADDPSTWSSPKTLSISNAQIEEGSVLVLSLAYPAGTTFSIVRKISNAARVDPIAYTAASSVVAVREDSTGSVYFFDGTYLYLRAMQPGAPWTDPLGFGEDGLWIPDRSPSWSILSITASWASSTGCGTDDWCRAATRDPPAAVTGEIAGGCERNSLAFHVLLCPGARPCSFTSSAAAVSGFPATFHLADTCLHRDDRGAPVRDKFADILVSFRFLLFCSFCACLRASNLQLPDQPRSPPIFDQAITHRRGRARRGK